MPHNVSQSYHHIIEFMLNILDLRRDEKKIWNTTCVLPVTFIVRKQYTHMLVVREESILILNALMYILWKIVVSVLETRCIHISSLDCTLYGILLYLHEQSTQFTELNTKEQ